MTGEITWRELRSQPDAWAGLIARLSSGALRLPVRIEDYDEILLLGSGSSYYLAMAVADWLRRRGHAARAIPSCEAILDPFETRPAPRRRLAIGFSRSGYSSELILANRKLLDAGFETLGISCTAGSDLLRQSGHALLIAEGHEDGLVMLRSYSCMLIAAQWLFGSEADRKALAGLPDAGKLILKQNEAFQTLARSRAFDRFVFLGSGPAFPLALEAGLKIQETAIATSEAYHSLDYRHGPKACADSNTVVTLFALSERAHGLVLARDIKALGAALIVIGTDAAVYAEIADLVQVPGNMVSDDHAAAALMLPVHLFAHATALRRGCDPDAPVNLSKVVMF